jgi:hypothetical protein
MKLVPTLAAATLTAASLTACGSGGNKPVADPATSPMSPGHHVTRSASPSRSTVPRVSLSAGGAVATTIDPCQLVTQGEASSLANAGFGPGRESGSKIRHECVYGAQTPNVLTVYVVQAASPAAAQAGWDTLLSEAQQFAGGEAAGHVTLTPDSTVGDRAEWVELDLSQIGVSARGLAFLKGAVGVYLIDLVKGGAAPTRQDLADQAQTVIGRLP